MRVLDDSGGEISVISPPKLSVMLDEGPCGGELHHQQG